MHARNKETGRSYASFQIIAWVGIRSDHLRVGLSPVWPVTKYDKIDCYRRVTTGLMVKLCPCILKKLEDFYARLSICEKYQ